MEWTDTWWMKFKIVCLQSDSFRNSNEEWYCKLEDVGLKKVQRLKYWWMHVDKLLKILWRVEKLVNGAYKNLNFINQSMV